MNFSIPTSLSLPKDSQPSYRADIDGLRAIAVISVVLYHAGLPGFRSGFVGVDVFFAISGFLIGSIILRGAIQGTFNFETFYARRAKRILPLLLVVILTVLFFGWLLLDKEEFQRLGASSFSTTFAYSNLSFFRTQDYFNWDARLNPLLMTWSLGVEEQFYFLFPFFILGIVRYCPKYTLAAIGVLSATSFLLSLWSSWHYPQAAFYLLPSRAWELGAGACLGAHKLPNSQSPKNEQDVSSLKQSVVGLICLAAIVVSVSCFDETAPSPGFIAILPIFGALGLIGTPDGIINRKILSARPLVFVGTISYSWYLWHWPLMSYVRIISIATPPAWLFLSLAAASFLLAILSWKFIEQPFRRSQSRPVPLLIRYACAVLFVAIVATAVKREQGFPNRLSSTAIHLENSLAEGQDHCLADFEVYRPDESKRCFNTLPGRPNIALIGDSHASALSVGLKEYAEEHRVGMSSFTKSSCGPLLDVDMPKHGMPSFTKACTDFMKNSFATVDKDENIKVVVLAGYWDSYRALGPNFSIGLDNSIATLEKAGKKVVIVGDVPSLAINPAKLQLSLDFPLRLRIAKALWFGDEPFPINGLTRDIEPVDPLIKKKILSLNERTDILFLNLNQSLCNGETCYFRLNGELLYRDPQHLSVSGSHYVAKSFNLLEFEK